MWQRKQTVFFIISILLFIASSFVPFGHEATTDELNQVVNKAYTVKANYILSLLASAGVVAGIVGIALFKNRKLQSIVALCGGLIALALGICEYMLFHKAHFAFTFGVLLPMLAGLFFILALRGIRADEKLVKSIDRLRD